MSKFESFNKLVAGEKYTLVGMGEFGFPYSVQFKFLENRFEPYAQYKDAVTMVCKPKRKQKARGFRFYGSKECLIYSGWIEVNTEMFVKKSTNLPDHLTAFETSRACFDERYMQDAKKSVEQEPVVFIGKPEPKTDTLEPIYEVVDFTSGTKYYKSPSEMENAGYEVSGQVTSLSVRKELQYQSRYNGLCGPMWGGEKEGRPVLRYETQKVNDAMSS